MMSTMTSLTNKYTNLYFRIMSDTITKWHEMEEEERAQAIEQQKQLEERNGPMYIFALDFVDGKAYRYDISALCNSENWSSPGYWAVQTEECEAFLIGAGHSISNIEWMVTNKSEIEYGN